MTSVVTTVPTYALDPVAVLALGCGGILLGAWLKRRLPVLVRLSIPTSIVGGMVLALAAALLHNRVVNFEPDTTLRDLMMIAFMTTIGLSARWDLVRRGGKLVLGLWGLATVGAVLQNLLGMGLAHALGISPWLGILSGSVALTGGPATAVAFGSTFEKMGVHGAVETAIAAATFGIAVASLIGGYIGLRIIERRKLRPASNIEPIATTVGVAKAAPDPMALLQTVLWIGCAMGIGSLISAGFNRLGWLLPSYIGAMIAATLLRNFNDLAGPRRLPISQSSLDQCAEVALYLFIVMAVLSLRLWELAHLAVPLLVILVAQVALCWLMCVTVCFWMMGRDYRAAVIASGFAGFMLGITANAVACMQELVERFGPAPEAFLVVPVVGAFLIDLSNSLVITVMINLWR